MSHGDYVDRTDGQTGGRQTVTLCFPPDAASVISQWETYDIERQRNDGQTSSKESSKDSTDVWRTVITGVIVSAKLGISCNVLHTSQLWVCDTEMVSEIFTRITGIAAIARMSNPANRSDNVQSCILVNQSATMVKLEEAGRVKWRRILIGLLQDSDRKPLASWALKTFKISILTMND